MISLTSKKISKNFQPNFLLLYEHIKPADTSKPKLFSLLATFTLRTFMACVHASMHKTLQNWIVIDCQKYFRRDLIIHCSIIYEFFRKKMWVQQIFWQILVNFSIKGRYMHPISINLVEMTLSIATLICIQRK